eukprot:gnl/TRDRNA2_/TRDRNA2_125698_c0_seq1.p1 gnl/TRDRNA2_/TRDRNA2_125698_c0~~gnl/TRDRNA2_/TRDRNA2_125698_c0_seq1.p1  ORF type:complete len:710 (+),score=72.37 gnl/TRDRNA2_/TRDRNA2_125698_c0_seq1:400-2529(+)
MCSFLITSWAVMNLTAVNFFLQRRGPDVTETVQHGPFTFVHNLLHMTGERVHQPFVDGDAMAVYNGEIYNSRQVPEDYPERHSYRSDGECILPAYRHLGPTFPRVLDGEWALALIDFAASVAVLSTDVFSTKPLWYSLHEGFHTSSYESALLALGLPRETIHMANPNEVLVFQLENIHASLISRHAVHEFDLRQFKTSTTDWQHAFRRAVWKRIAASNHPVFVGLSSGYDSGALHLALEEEAPSHSVQYFTVSAEELPAILESRIRVFNKSVSRAWNLELSLTEFASEKQWLHQNTEKFLYGQSNWAGTAVQEDVAAAGLSAIFRRCRHAGLLVYLSGAGADEIMSDYGFAGVKFFPHSSFGGQFPEELAELFPWRSVFLGTQRDYLMKEEVVAGGHGLEARYPFLDRRVVQEFLWLSTEAKNSFYKRPVHDFLASAGYPFDEGKKAGFAASRNLKLVGSTSVEVLFDAMQTVRTQQRLPDLPELNCGAESRDRNDLWRSARSRLAAFLLTPEDLGEAVEELGSVLLGMLNFELQGASDCELGQLCLRLFLLLLTVPDVRDAQLAAGTGVGLWSSLIGLPWGWVVRSGWPLFGLLHRLIEEVADPEAAREEPLMLAGLVPLIGCSGKTHDEELLDAPLAMLAASNTDQPSLVARIQPWLAAYWEGQPLLTVLRSARMCEMFSALEHQSEPHYRVNLADAWHMLPWQRSR